MRPRLYTVGHSTRSFEELVALLQEHAIARLVDVRHFPRSRRNPQFNQEELAATLPGRGIAYVWMGEELGGFRPGGYQAYMETPAYALGLDRLEQMVDSGPTTAIMCAEIVWFRCHRRYIARSMATHGYPVRHIVARGKEGYDEALLSNTIST